ncbi:topoisomerase DNA-binding C4 zinc finger domain-containing protein [Alteromonas sp. A081]|uniref:DNA topoisomerase family protein n=1 Tax=Alteromonas sp. A081 TaxID=3410269 RepID=UPI003B986A39
MSKIDHSLFSAHEHALEESFGDCPECGKPLRIKNSKTGPFIGCTAYPECHFSKPLHDNQTALLKTLDGVACPDCQSELGIKKGRYGMFIGCTNFPTCHFIAPLKQQEETQVRCPKCQLGELISRTSKFGKQFFACNHYPTCRYVLNFEPVSEQCPECGWGVLIDKKGQYVCPQPSCGFKK